MSLLTDVIFVKALQSDETLLGQLPAGDVYNTSIALPDEELDNAPLPYVVVSFDSLENDQSTKDGYEGETDTVNISIEVAAKTRKQLGDLTERIRTTVREYFEAAQVVPLTEPYDELVPLDYQFSAAGVQYDSLKPCYWQVMSYQCDVNI